MGQRTRYVNDDGSNTPIRTDALTVAIAWTNSTRRIPAKFAVAVAYHESNFKTNQQDDDTRTQDDGSEKVIHRTGGVFQLDIPSVSPFQKGDAIAAFGPILGAPKSVYDLQDACDIFAALSENRLDWLESQFPDLDMDSKLFWLAVGHNMGTGAMRKSATKHAGSVQEFIDENPSNNIVAHGYGRDAMTGGPYYNSDMEADVTDPTGASAPTVNAKSKMVGGWLLFLVVLLAVWWFAYGRHDRKVNRWLADI